MRDVLEKFKYKGQERLYISLFEVRELNWGHMRCVSEGRKRKAVPGCSRAVDGRVDCVCNASAVCTGKCTKCTGVLGNSKCSSTVIVRKEDYVTEERKQQRW